MQLRRFGTTKLMVIGGLICVVSPAFPQQPQPDPKEINLVAGNLASQRNDAQNNVAVLQAKLALAEEKIKELELKLKEKEKEKEKPK